MHSASEKSVEELREDSARTRVALAGTVEALRERVGDTASELKTLVSPAHIKQEIRHYVQNQREGLIDTMQRKVQENPLQMAAIGAAVAYPALQMVRAIPAPLWLIGAGLFLTSRRGQETMKDVRSRVEDAVQQGTEAASEMAGSIRSDVERKIAGAREQLTDVQERASARLAEVQERASSKVNELTGAARSAYQDATRAVGDTAGEVADRMSGSSDDFARRGGDAAAAVGHRATAAAMSTRNTVADFVNQNPLLVAGLGLAAGALLAASIPPSDAENRFFGQSRERLKDTARQAVENGMEKAADMAVGAAGAAVAAAAREGLDAGGLKGSVQNVANKMRAVADRGLDSALGNNTSSNGTSPNANGASHHQETRTERNPT